MFDREARQDNAMDTSEAVVRLAGGQRAVVELDPDHPGFRDEQYRARRNAIAQIAVDYRPGDPIPDTAYSAQEQQVWSTVRQALAPVHARHACSEYLASLERLDLPGDRIPQLREVSHRIEPLSKFRLEPVAGLVTPRVFLSVLAHDTFLATQYIRHHSAPLYTPEPDVVHELMGHAVMLASPLFAGINRLVGTAVRRTRTEAGIDFLSKVFWYTVEFGALVEDGEVRAYGAGLLSSAGELAAMHQAELRPIDFAEMGRRDYDVTRFQPVLYVADSLSDLLRRLGQFLEQWDERAPPRPAAGH
ncbi:MAG: phenylalanine 4-monooxygenase [Pseudomonadota bacterium]